MPSVIDPYLLGAAIVLLISVFASKISDRFGIPVLILFLLAGMLAGADGPGRIYFDDPVLTQALATIALVFILFTGGFDTPWDDMRPVIKEGVALATLGVFLTTLSVAIGVWALFKPSFLLSLLIGAIVSSTDAPAVFALLRSKGIALKGNLKALLELESGSNDPMAVFLTVSIAQLLINPVLPMWSLIPLFFQQMLIGLALGYIGAKITLFLLNRLTLSYSGLYPILCLGMVVLVFAAAAMLNGSGYLAVYLCGLLLNKGDFEQKQQTRHFFDSLAWLMQIIMFFTLGLFVFPAQLGSVWLPGVVLALYLIFIARPFSVLTSLLWCKMPLSQKVFLSWGGLRGAVPIVLAIYPRVMQIENSHLIFNLVFFVVVVSVLLQGTFIGLAGKWLRVTAEEGKHNA